MGVKRVSTTVASENGGPAGLKHAKNVCNKTELLLFEPINEQASILEDMLLEIAPIAPLSNNGAIIFDVAAAEDFYTDLYESYFKVKVKLKRSNGQAIDKDVNKVAPVNAFLTSLFSRVSLNIQGVKIGSDTTLHPFIAYISQLLSYSADAKRTHLENQCIWSKDSGSNPASAVFSENLSLNTRQALVEKEKTLYGKMALDLTNQPKLIPNRTSLVITLERSPAEFALITEEEEKYKFEITDCALILRRVRLSPSIVQSIENRLTSQPAQYPFVRMDARTFTIPMGVKQWKAQNVFSGYLPRRVIYVVLPQLAANGSYDKNPFVFGNHHITYVNFYSDSQSVMLRPLEPDFTKNDYIDCYWALLRAMRKQSSGFPLDIGWGEYREQSCLFAHDLAPDIGSPSRSGNFSVETKFKKETTETLTGLVIGEFKACMLLNKHREVSWFDY